MVTETEILEKLGTVMDPEIPGLSIVEMGMVGEVRVHQDEVAVDLIPTFLGCPALELIQQRVEAALKPYGATVRFRYDIPWSSDRINQAGRARLAAWGVAPPLPETRTLPRCPLCGSPNTEKQSDFGPSLCRALYYCRDCQQPFEGMKTI